MEMSFARRRPETENSFKRYSANLGPEVFTGCPRRCQFALVLSSQDNDLSTCPCYLIDISELSVIYPLMEAVRQSRRRNGGVVQQRRQSVNPFKKQKRRRICLGSISPVQAFK